MFKVTDYVKDDAYDVPGAEGYLRKHPINYVSCGSVADVMIAVGQILNANAVGQVFSASVGAARSKTCVVRIVDADVSIHNTVVYNSVDAPHIRILEWLHEFLAGNCDAVQGLSEYPTRQIVFEF